MPARLTPYRRFAILLALSVTLAAAALAGTVSLLVGRNMVASTAAVTEAAVTRHFSLILPGIFDEALDSGQAPGGYGASDHADHAANDYAAAPAATVDPYAAEPAPSPTRSDDATDLTVRLHFDLYNITDTVFFRPDGDVAFAYDPARARGRASRAEWNELERARSGPVVVPDGRGVRIAMAVRGEDIGREPGIVGYVAIERDLRAEWAEVRRIQLATLAAAAAAALLLFLVLRGVYLASTREIEHQSRDLAVLAAELRTTYDASLAALSGALDSRDRETAGRAERVTRYAVRLGRELDMVGQALVDLERGALLHDVGKIGIPDAILRKPGPLDDREREVMRSHVVLGDRLLEGIPFLDAARDVVRAHHERWDGRGYPRGLIGDQTPLAARVFALCDVYDAMTSDRPYARGRTDPVARSEIVASSGSHFDPAVVEAFLRIPADEWLLTGRGHDLPPDLVLDPFPVPVRPGSPA